MEEIQGRLNKETVWSPLPGAEGSSGGGEVTVDGCRMSLVGEIKRFENDFAPEIWLSY